MKLGLITPWHTDDPRAWSGMIVPITRALAAHVELVDLKAGDLKVLIADRALARFTGTVTGRGYLTSLAVATAADHGRALRRRVARSGVDVVLGVAASQQLAFLKVDVPVVAVSDATVERLIDYYPAYTNLGGANRRQGRLVDLRSFRMAATCILSSRWAAESVTDDYAIPPGKCRVIPFGPAIEPPSPWAPLDPRRPHSPLRLLALCRDWKRKQGDVCVATAAALNDRGIPAALTVVGELPAEHRSAAYVTATGVLDSADVPVLYQNHDILLDLASANCSSVAVCDAMAFGLPVVATDTGGTRDIVGPQLYGSLVPRTRIRITESAVEAVKRLSDGSAYSAAARAGRQRYEDRLNWTVWASQVVSECAAAMAAGQSKSYAAGGSATNPR